MKITILLLFVVANFPTSFDIHPNIKSLRIQTRFLISKGKFLLNQNVICQWLYFQSNKE